MPNRQIVRLVSLYRRLIAADFCSRETLATEFAVTKQTIDRDLARLRSLDVGLVAAGDGIVLEADAS